MLTRLIWAIAACLPKPFHQLLGLQVGFKVGQNQEFFIVLQEVVVQGPAFADAARNRSVNQGVNRLLHDWVAFIEVTWVVGVVCIVVVNFILVQTEGKDVVAANRVP